VHDLLAHRCAAAAVDQECQGPRTKHIWTI
jgi:hypothetical protein